MRALLLWLITWACFSSALVAQEPLTDVMFATRVAERLRDERPACLKKSIHWLIAVDISKSMNGKWTVVSKMLRSLMQHTVVQGDRVSRLRFGDKLDWGPEKLEVTSGLAHVDPIAHGLDPTGNATAAAEARNKCRQFVQKNVPGHVRIAMLISDSAENDGGREGQKGTTADFTWRGSVIADRGKPVDLVVLFWVGTTDNVEEPSIELDRRVPETVDRLEADAVAAQDPDGPKRRAYHAVPFFLAALTAIVALFGALRPYGAYLRATGRSATLPLGLLSKTRAPVNSSGSGFYLTRTVGTAVPDGTVVLNLSIKEPYRIWSAFRVLAVGASDTLSGRAFELDVNGSGYDHRAELPIGKCRVSIRSSAGVVVRDEALEITASGLRWGLWALALLFFVWLLYFVAGPSYLEKLQPPRPGIPAVYKKVPRPLLERSLY